MNDDDNIILLKHFDLLIICTLAKYNKAFATNRCAYDDNYQRDTHDYALMQLLSNHRYHYSTINVNIRQTIDLRTQNHFWKDTLLLPAKSTPGLLIILRLSMASKCGLSSALSTNTDFFSSS